MRRYETIFIADPDIPEERRSQIFDKIKDTVKVQNGFIAEFDEWGIKKLAYEMPVFAGLSYMATGKSKESLMIFSHIQNRNQATQLAKLLKENGIDLDQKGVGFMQVIKVEDVIGSFEEEIEV